MPSMSIRHSDRSSGHGISKQGFSTPAMASVSDCSNPTIDQNGAKSGRLEYLIPPRFAVIVGKSIIPSRLPTVGQVSHSTSLGAHHPPAAVSDPPGRLRSLVTLSTLIQSDSVV